MCVCVCEVDSTAQLCVCEFLFAHVHSLYVYMHVGMRVCVVSARGESSGAGQLTSYALQRIKSYVSVSAADGR